MSVDQFHIPGMTSTHAINAIHTAISTLPGIHRIAISGADKSVRIEHDERVSVRDVLAVLQRAGYHNVSVLA